MKFRVVAQMEKKRRFLGSAQRIRLAAILVVITGIGAAGGPVAEAAPGNKGPELSAAEIYKRVRPKIVRIEGKNGGHGTGFYFGEESGLVMTAAHVVAAAGSMRVVHANGEVHTRHLGSRSQSTMTADEQKDVYEMTRQKRLPPAHPLTLNVSDERQRASSGIPALEFVAPYPPQTVYRMTPPLAPDQPAPLEGAALLG